MGDDNPHEILSSSIARIIKEKIHWYKSKKGFSY
jgi:hypothetical protein